MSANPKSVCIPCRRVYKGEGRRNIIEDREAQPRVGKARSIKGIPVFPRRWVGTGAAMQIAPDVCPECRQPTVRVWSGWRPPRRTNDRAWKRIARGDWATEQGVVR